MKLCQTLGFALIAASILGVWIDPRFGNLYAVGVVLLIIGRVLEYRRAQHG